MLEKILQVKGIGLLHNANGGCHELHKVNIIYADNGRGKSTLASLFRSCSTGNPELLLKRRTIDGSYNPKVDLLFSNEQHEQHPKFENGDRGRGHKHPAKQHKQYSNSKFENGCWDVKRPEFLVFDADFVEQNIYAGGQVTTEQRRNLLEFALGESAVITQEEYDKADQEDKISAEVVSKATSQLSDILGESAVIIQEEYDKADQDATTAADVVAKTKSQLIDIHKGLTLENFENIAQAPNADDQIATLNKKINEAQNIDSIQSKPLPLQLVAPTLNIESFFDILGKSLDNIDAAAEQQVKYHLDTHNKPQLEKWISDGHAYGEEENCLFCNQPLEGVQLIQAYRSYFNQEYKQLKSDVDQLAGLIAKICSNEIIYKLEAQFDATIACINDWQKDIEITTPIFDKNIARNALANIQSLLEKLKRSKEVKLLDGIGSKEDRNKVVKERQTILDVVVACNKSISNAAELIIDYKANLIKLNIEDLRQQVRNLEMAKTRYRPDVIKLLALIKTGYVQKKEAEEKKRIQKIKLNEFMDATLGLYTGRINKLLDIFGAQFCIPNINFNYRSGIRSDYALQMRGQNIGLSGGTPDFKTSLSEGDKRTLAFAFFIASVEADPDLANKIIIIDDPICSLDLNRKQQTCTVLKKLHYNCKQMIIFAHDIYFINDFLDVFSKDQSKNIKRLKLKAVENNYSDFDTIDIERECESSYFRCHRMLCKYVNREIEPSIGIAMSIRPLLEGYLHNRFPNLMDDKPSFGRMIKKITESKPSSPLVNAQKITDELNEINCYSRRFHHNSQARVVDIELLGFVKRALAVVYGEEISPKT